MSGTANPLRKIRTFLNSRNKTIVSNTIIWGWFICEGIAGRGGDVFVFEIPQPVPQFSQLGLLPSRGVINGGDHPFDELTAQSIPPITRQAKGWDIADLGGQLPQTNPVGSSSLMMTFAQVQPMANPGARQGRDNANDNTAEEGVDADEVGEVVNHGIWKFLAIQAVCGFLGGFFGTILARKAFFRNDRWEDAA